MCRGPDKSTPASVRADSTLSYSSDGTEYSDVPPSLIESRSFYSLDSKDYSERTRKESSQKPLSSLSVTLAGISLAAGMLGFGLWFPFVTVPEASTKTYEWAGWSYDSKRNSFFDNSAWTFGTDYVLALIMGYLSYSILTYSQRANTDRLSNRSASLLLLYMISVTAGGIAHQTFTTLESRNTIEFRLLWTICVGTVTLANTSMGMSATEIVRKFQSERLSTPIFDKLPHIPELFWWTYGICNTAFTAWGGMSFQRPACDIFIAGCTQTPPTFYMMAALLFLEHPKILFKVRILGMVGFILNAPLLPLYPMLIQYTNMSLASVNTLLHCWLTVAWSMQGYAMRHVIQALYTNEKVKQS